eukprot:717123-Amphidinium_carterae.1
MTSHDTTMFMLQSRPIKAMLLSAATFSLTFNLHSTVTFLAACFNCRTPLLCNVVRSGKWNFVHFWNSMLDSQPLLTRRDVKPKAVCFPIV